MCVAIRKFECLLCAKYIDKSRTNDPTEHQGTHLSCDVQTHKTEKKPIKLKTKTKIYFMFRVFYDRKQVCMIDVILQKHLNNKHIIVFNIEICFMFKSIEDFIFNILLKQHNACVEFICIFHRQTNLL